MRLIDADTGENFTFKTRDELSKFKYQRYVSSSALRPFYCMLMTMNRCNAICARSRSVMACLATVPSLTCPAERGRPHW